MIDVSAYNLPFSEFIKLLKKKKPQQTGSSKHIPIFTFCLPASKKVFPNYLGEALQNFC